MKYNIFDKNNMIKQNNKFYLSILRKKFFFKKKLYYIPKDFIYKTSEETTFYTLHTNLKHIETILYGGFSIILFYKALYNSSITMAVKIYASKIKKDNKKKKHNYEIDFYQSIDYENDEQSQYICYCYGSFNEIYKEKYQYTYLFLENLQYDLYNYLFIKKDSLQLFKTFEQLKQTLLILSKAIQFIHDKGYIYNDLKFENIMLSKENKIKVIDFNCLVPVDDDKKLNKHFIGTIDYLAPELFIVDKDKSKNVYYNYKENCCESDYWTFGIFLYELLSKRTFPYISKDSKTTIENIKLNLLDNENYAYEFLKSIKKKRKLTNDEFEYFATMFINCMKTNPKERKLIM